MGLLIALQDFSDAGQDAETNCPEQILPGYDAGFAAGQAEAAAAQALVDKALVQSFEDLSFGFAEARQVILQGLTPLFEALVDHILPNAVDPVFRCRLVEQLWEAAKIDSHQPCLIALHPEQIAPVQSILQQIGISDVRVESRADQPVHSALIKKGVVETALDTDAVLAGLNEILDAYFDTAKEQENHG